MTDNLHLIKSIVQNPHIYDTSSDSFSEDKQPSCIHCKVVDMDVFVGCDDIAAKGFYLCKNCFNLCKSLTVDQPRNITQTSFLDILKQESAMPKKRSGKH